MRSLGLSGLIDQNWSALPALWRNLLYKHAGGVRGQRPLPSKRPAVGYLEIGRIIQAGL
jgi:hypothetical protein